MGCDIQFKEREEFLHSLKFLHLFCTLGACENCIQTYKELTYSDKLNHIFGSSVDVHLNQVNKSLYLDK